MKKSRLNKLRCASKYLFMPASYVQLHFGHEIIASISFRKLAATSLILCSILSWWEKEEKYSVHPPGLTYIVSLLTL